MLSPQNIFQHGRKILSWSGGGSSFRVWIFHPCHRCDQVLSPIKHIFKVVVKLIEHCEVECSDWIWSRCQICRLSGIKFLCYTYSRASKE
jgi:hypothetical protein